VDWFDYSTHLRKVIIGCMELVKTWERWCQVFNDMELFRPEVLEICRMHGVRVQRLGETFPGTHAVFYVNEDTVLKLFCPVQYSSYGLELALHEGLLRGSAYFPKILFHGTSPSGYDYLAFERFSGLPIRERRLDCLTPEVLESLAELVVWMHSVPLEPGLMASGVVPSLDVEPSLRCLVHYDLTRDHIFLDEAGRLQGVIDFGDAVLGQPADDFPVLFVDSFACDDRLIESFSQMYNQRSPGYRVDLDEVVRALDRHPFVEPIRAIAQELESDFARILTGSRSGGKQKREKWG
jgi:hypothetical protein